MKRLFLLAFAIAALLPVAARAQVTATAGTARVEVYAGQNPDTNETNLGPRFSRLQMGTLLRDLFASSGLTGAWNGINIVSTTGLYVTINPAPSSQYGSIYQMGVDDATALPPSPGQPPNQIPADNTRIMIQATQAAATTALGPFPAPGGAGNATYYIVEAQLSPADTDNQSRLFVSTSGITSYQNINTQRQDQITYQVGTNTSTGTADCNSTFPSQPSPDSGWIEVGLVCVPHGTTQLTSALIAMFTNTQFTNSQFGTVSFGGNYAVSGGTSPSILTTSTTNSCDSGTNGGLGFSIHNPASVTTQDPGGNIIRADLTGDFTMCGASLLIDAQHGTLGVPNIVVDTTVDTSSPQDETFYPASTSGNFTANAFTITSCSVNTRCTLSATKTICYNAGTPTGALITFANSDAGDFTASVSAAPGGGFNVALYNISGGTLSSGTYSFGYVCL